MRKRGVTIITPTGGRPETLKLCSFFIARQTYSGLLQWVVVDDAEEPSPIPRIPSTIMTHVRPTPYWTPEQNTLARNLLAAIPEVEFDRVLFFEDDDWYASDYVEAMLSLLDAGKIAGDPTTPYYHWPLRKIRVMKNSGFASLCQTGMHDSLLPKLEEVCKGGNQFIDGRLWQGAQERVFGPIGKVVGMKGLPGRKGIGVGHRPEIGQEYWEPDQLCAKLRRLIGDDVALYERFDKK